MAQPEAEESEVEALIRAYYCALEQGAPLASFYAADAAAGALGPVVKIGSDKGEVFTGFAAVAAAVNRVTATLTRNRLESRALLVRRAGDVAWFFDLVWWSGEAAGPPAGPPDSPPDDSSANPAGGPGRAPFASLTRWTGVCLRTPAGWKFVQVHVSEGIRAAG